MTDRIALVLILVITALIAADLWFDWGGTLFVLRRALVFLDWVMFWR